MSTTRRSLLRLLGFAPVAALASFVRRMAADIARLPVTVIRREDLHFVAVRRAA